MERPAEAGIAKHASEARQASSHLERHLQRHFEEHFEEHFERQRARDSCYLLGVVEPRLPSEERRREELYEALSALRDAPDVDAQRCSRHWVVVAAWLFERAGASGEDDAQEALLAVRQSVHAMVATNPGQAIAWLRRILKHKEIDRIRKRKRDPFLFGDSHDDDPILRVPAPEPGLNLELFDEVIARIEKVCLDFVDASDALPSRRLTRRNQARAAIHRLLRELDATELAAELAPPVPVSQDLLYQWVARGRPWVIEAMERWAAEAGDDEEVARISGIVIERMRERRADAGRPRPGARGRSGANEG